MDPNQPQRPNPPRPKVSLLKLDALFMKDMGNEELTPHLRLFAGRCHQLLLHMLLLLRVRQRENQQIQASFQQITAVLQQITGTEAPDEEPPPDGPEAAPPEEAPPGEPAPAAPPAAEQADVSPPPPPKVAPGRRPLRANGTGT